MINNFLEQSHQGGQNGLLGFRASRIRKRSHVGKDDPSCQQPGIPELHSNLPREQSPSIEPIKPDQENTVGVWFQ